MWGDFRRLMDKTDCLTPLRACARRVTNIIVTVVDFAYCVCICLYTYPHTLLLYKVVSVDMSQLRVHVKVKVKLEPDLDAVMSNRRLYLHYTPSYVVAQQLGIPPLALSRITGNVQVERGSKAK